MEGENTVFLGCEVQQGAQEGSEGLIVKMLGGIRARTCRLVVQ